MCEWRSHQGDHEGQYGTGLCVRHRNLRSRAIA
jgi:hypothetical protein